MSKSNIYVEIVTYQLAPGAVKENYLPAVHALQEEVQKLEGFLSRRVFYSSAAGRWTEVVEWSNQEAAKQAEQCFMKHPVIAAGFALIAQDTIELQWYEQIL
jgi:hypothetical protein